MQSCIDEANVLQLLIIYFSLIILLHSVVVQAGRDFSYLIAIIGGFGLTGFLFYSVGSEFFSSNSPSSIFTQALKRVKADDQVHGVCM